QGVVAALAVVGDVFRAADVEGWPQARHLRRTHTRREVGHRVQARGAIHEDPVAGARVAAVDVEVGHAGQGGRLNADHVVAGQAVEGQGREALAAREVDHGPVV